MEQQLVVILLGVFTMIGLVAVLIWMPKDTHCNSCRVQLNPHRRKTYHNSDDWNGSEVCESCYKQGRSPSNTADKRIPDLKKCPVVQNPKSTPTRNHKSGPKSELKSLAYPRKTIEVKPILKSKITCSLSVILKLRTVSLETPLITELVILSQHDDVLFKCSIDKQDTTEKINELYTEIKSVMKGKTVISINSEYDLAALEHTFTEFNDSTFKSFISGQLSLLNIIHEKLKLNRKYLSFPDACKMFNVELTPNPTINDEAKTLSILFNEFTIVDEKYSGEWLPEYTDIQLNHLRAVELNSLIVYWSSEDDLRHILFHEKSAVGSMKIAELKPSLINKIEQYGSTSFYIDTKELLPQIKVKHISKEDFADIVQKERSEYKAQYLQELINAKPATKGKLKMDFNNGMVNLFELNGPIFKKPYTGGDRLYLSPLTFSESFDYRDVKFFDDQGECVGKLQNLTKQWTRVFGLLMKGYHAEVVILTEHKFAKDSVYVHFFKNIY